MEKFDMSEREFERKRIEDSASYKWVDNQRKIKAEIIQAQQEYIQFLENEISNHTTSFLNVHGILTSEEVGKQGERLRKQIDKLKKQLYD
jgi:hypothetical protein